MGTNKIYEDITGQRYGKLVIFERYYCHNGKRKKWKARCDCGGVKEGIDTGNWKLNRFSNCGCSKLPEINVGDRFHEWTVNQRSGEGRKLYGCTCSCGKTSLVSKTDLIYGKSKRCLSCSHKLAIKPDFQAAINSIKKTYLQSARKRELSWGIDSMFVTLITSPCHYCGVGPSMCRTTSNASFWYNGIDRLDNDNGYESDNVVSCCSICNYAKRAMRYDHFTNWLDRIVAFRATQERRDRL